MGESNDDWKISATTGNSALYSSLEYLQFDSTEYEQHVVGWTGEITRTERNLFTREAKEKPQDLDDDPLYLTKEQINGLTTTLQDHMKSDKEAKTDTTQTAPVTNNVHPVWLLRKNQSRWRNYAEKVIWPTFHYILNPSNEGEQEKNWWYDYVKFNEAYAQKIGEVYRKGDIIWIHDYYLLLLPQLLSKTQSYSAQKTSRLQKHESANTGRNVTAQGTEGRVFTEGYSNET